MLDLGANADVRPDMIVQFAHMGIAFARAALNKESLRIALLSNGTEDTKGSTAMQAFLPRCKKHRHSLQQAMPSLWVIAKAMIS